MFSLVSGNMKDTFLCLNMMYSMWCDIEDLTIPLLLLPYCMCLDKIGDPMIASQREWWQDHVIPDWWIHHCRGVHSRKCTAGHCLVLMCELCHLCLSDNPGSILHQRVFCLQLICFSLVKAQNPVGGLLVFYKKRRDCNRRWEGKGEQE